MPDRRRRTAFRHPLPEPASLLMRERQSPTPGPSSSSSSSDSSSASSPSGSGSSGSSGARPEDDNPFAPPPENRPDQPWQPRHPVNGDSNGNGEGGDGGDAPEDGSADKRPVWGSQWSSHQPGRQNGGFGGGPAGPNGPTGPNGQGGGRGGPEGGSGGMRWDPTDPVQRRARYALLSGMWAFFFALFDLPEIALLLGALATYWSISALRAKPKAPSATGEGTGPATAPRPDPFGPGPGAASGPDQAPGSAAAPAAPGAGLVQRGSRQQTTAAVSGLVTALIALAIVATSFTVQLVYRDYYTCVNDALTKSGQLSCNDLLPKPLEPLFGVKK
ncbi:hypothetical protein ACIQOF_19240 [Streptomyces sp. NPDC091265]|uniref:hypothetical protein n=1 Tax=unclassified Streptomyces TaxID=2593676 RepID=UPI00344C260E